MKQQAVQKKKSRGKPKTDWISIVDKEFEKIKKAEGNLSPRLIVEKAKDKNSPLHKYFEWNDSKAGEGYRLWQARMLINRITITISGEQVPKYENCSITIREVNEDGDREEVVIKGYKTYQEIKSSEEYKQEILLRALREIESWKSTYDRYSEFKNINKEIDKTSKLLNKKFKK